MRGIGEWLIGAVIGKRLIVDGDRRLADRGGDGCLAGRGRDR